MTDTPHAISDDTINTSNCDTADYDNARRWRLILGRYADDDLGNANLSADELKLERCLDYLYRHEYQRRGIKQGNRQNGIGGGLESSQLSAINWLNQSRKLFPKSTFERMQNHALERYQMTDILKKAENIKALEPNPATAKALLSLRGHLNHETKEAIKELITKVVQEIMQKIRPNFIQALSGRRNRFSYSLIKQSQNFDYKKTIRHNLKNYNSDSKQLIIERTFFNSRVQKHLEWEVILCVDQSGSMSDSIMYASICASILASLPSVSTHLVVFDTQVVDLSHMAHDPVEVLLTIQLGGGTLIGQAIDYCAKKITNPRRSILIVISDFEEGGSLTHLYQSISKLNEQGTKLLGLAALDNNANPCYDPYVANELSNRGMHIGAMTPEHLATWLGDVMN